MKNVIVLQVNFDGPNFDKFPQFREAKGFEAVVSPGDVVYVPAYWWRYIENSDQGFVRYTVNY